ncbi:hypothetical protein BsWGS_18774 [Bradybaena similaris]
MRRIGLKLVFVAAVALLLVTSVRQQWNSSQHKLARHESSSNTLMSKTAEDRLGEFGDVDTSDEKADNLDASLEDNSSETKPMDENNDVDHDVSSINQSRVSNVQEEEFHEDIANQDKDEAPVYVGNVNTTTDTKGSIDSPQLVPPLHVAPESLGDQAELNKQDAQDADADIPDYNDSSEQDPNWRSSKYANDLYADDEEDENDSTNDNLHSNYNDIAGNENALEESEEAPDTRFVGDVDSRYSSVLSWLRLGKYFDVEKTNMEGILENSRDSIISDTNLLDDTAHNISGIDYEDSFLTDKEKHETDKSSNTIYKEIDNTINESTNKSANDTSNFTSSQVEGDKLQSKLTDKELPFSVNGIDVADYDDFEDVDMDDDQNQMEGSQNSLDHKDVSSKSDAIKSDAHLETDSSNGKDGVPFVEAKHNVFHFGDQVHPTGHTKSPDFYKPYDTLHDQQKAQALIYEPRQLPTNLLQRLSPQKSYIPPRILDLILANNLELSHSPQFLANLKYYLHQSIQRIDQDVEPDTLNKNRNAIFKQSQLWGSPPSKSNGLLLSKMAVVRESNNGHIQQIDNDQSQETNNNDDIYDNNYDDNGTFYDAIHTNIDVDETSDSRNDMNRQAGIYTPPPDPALYDNPRPLSESQFALYRTKPYNTNYSLTKSVSDSPVYLEFTDNFSKKNNTILAHQQINTPNTNSEDETLPCPREPNLAKTTHPVTALVSFSDSSTSWFRNTIEQLTGVVTDSIYNIMAQLKAGNAESVYQMGRKILIETHMASVKNFDRAVVLIRNPFSVDAHHKIFRPSSVDWEKIVLWNQTYSIWLNSSLPVHVMTFEDLVESPLTELMKLTKFLSPPGVTISYKCAMKIALDPPSVVDNLQEITGIYHDDRRIINQNIDYVIQIALKKHQDIVLRLNSYKVLPGT